MPAWLLPLLFNWKTWLIAGFAALLAMVAVDGWRIKHAKAELAALHGQVSRMAADAELAAKQASVSDKVAADHAAAQSETQTVYRDRIQKVIQYVPAKADADCTIANGAVRLLDNPASVPLPNAPGELDAAASATRLSELVANDLANQEAARLNANTVLAWQAWARGQAALNAPK